MLENIKQQQVNVDEWVKKEPEKVIDYLHKQYAIAKIELKNKSLSLYP